MAFYLAKQQGRIQCDGAWQASIEGSLTLKETQMPNFFN